MSGTAHPGVAPDPRRSRAASAVLTVSIIAGSVQACSPAFVGFTSPCTIARESVALPREIHESSGVAYSALWSEAAAGGVQAASVLWTHNDGENTLFAVDQEGGLVQSVQVSGSNLRDWEDLAAGPCPDEGTCLYLADTGDNSESRDWVGLLRVREPAPGSTVTEAPERFVFRFPDGPRDVEALYLLPPERIFLVTKGRNHPVEIYRVPPLDSGELVLEHAQTLTDEPPSLPRWVTGATATPAGDLVAIRTYETLQIYRPEPDGELTVLPGGLTNLRFLQQIQGEAVGFLPGEDGAIELVLTSEAGPLGGLGTMGFLRCEGPTGL